MIEFLQADKGVCATWLYATSLVIVHQELARPFIFYPWFT